MKQNPIGRRSFLKLVGYAATGTLAGATGGFREAAAEDLSRLYDLPMRGSARLLHTTDVHAQLLPVYYREPNVNIGVGDATGQLPHLVDSALLERVGFEPGSIEAYAYTSLDFDTAAREFGRMGGMAQLKTLYDMLRDQAGGVDNTLSLDGGDLWQGSATALWTRGQDMVEVSNLLGVDIMTGHWEFTYHEAELLSNLQRFNGEFLAQNVRVKEDALFEDAYFEMVEKFGGLGLFDEDNAITFQPYSIREVGGQRVAVIGQAFPRTANANAQEFIRDWTFGIREESLANIVAGIREQHQPAAVVLLSHNGMDVDIKLASRVDGIDAILGGHTHDGIPVPVEVASPDGGTCLVTNAGSCGKFVGVLDMDLSDGALSGMEYYMLPVFEDLLAADQAMAGAIDGIRSRVYDDGVVECRAEAFRFNPDRVGKTYSEILSEQLARADRTLFRRGNFMGTWDQLICDALAWEYDAQVTLSPGFRWGTTVLEGEWITMEDVMTQTAMTYPETYVQDMSGENLLTILESVADNLFDPDPYFQSGGDMVRVGGLDYTINPNKPLLERITDARLAGGGAIEPAGSYRVAGWGVVGPHPDGRPIWDIVHDYLLARRDAENVIRIPRVFHPAVAGVTDNPGISDYPGELLG